MLLRSGLDGKNGGGNGEEVGSHISQKRERRKEKKNTRWEGCRLGPIQKKKKQRTKSLDKLY